MCALQGPKAVQPANVLQAPLPNAKNFRVYCMYGVGTPTERGYHYLKTRKAGRGGTVHTEWSINNVADDPKSGLVRWWGLQMGQGCFVSHCCLT